MTNTLRPSSEALWHFPLFTTDTHLQSEDDDDDDGDEEVIQ